MSIDAQGACGVDGPLRRVCIQLSEGVNSLIPFASWTTQDCISAITDRHDAVSLKTAETITVDGKLVQRQ